MDAPHLETVCTFKWKAHEGYRTEFLSEHVNILRRMVARNYAHPHRFVCITDDATGLDPEIEVVPLWDTYANVHNPSGHPKNPSCYRRLKVFDPDIESVLGKRFVVMDIDMIVTGDLTPLWSRPEDLVLLQNYNPQTTYNGSMLMMTAGARPQVWTEFDPLLSPRLSHAAKQWGSDQGWISYKLGPDEARWTTDDGVYSFRMHMRRDPDTLPQGCRLIAAHGLEKPWGLLQKHAWCREHYI